MERIFEKVMLRKMTDEEKEILELNGHCQAEKNASAVRAIRVRRKGARI